MRRNFRLTLLLIFLSALYILILLYNGTSTLQKNVYSVSGLTDNLLVFVPTSSKYYSVINIRSANAKIQVRGIIHQQHARIRPKVKVAGHPKRTKDKRIKLWTRYAIRSNPNAGRGQELQNISKTEIQKNFRRHSYVPAKNSQSIPTPDHVMTSPNSQKTQTNQVRGSDGTSSNVRVFPKTKISPMEVQKQVQVRNGNGKGRRASESTSGVRVIIVAHGRSGSSFFGGIFNAHPDFFFIYEPLNQLKRIVNRNSNEYIDSAEYVVNAILKCNFENDGFLEIMSRVGHHRASCRPLVSPPFCNTTHEKAINFVANQNWKSCNGTISADILNKICRKHANIASKILLESLEPADLSWILYISGSYPVPPSFPGLQPTVRAPKSPENEDKPVYVLYLVRDPRAMIYSRHRLGWVVPPERKVFALESGEADDMVKTICDTIELNLGMVLRHPHRIKLVRYEELVTNPERLVRDLFSELGISPSKEVFRWINSKTHGPINFSAFSLSHKSNVSINAWRNKIPVKLLEIIETRCERIMKYLGYLPSNGSQEILHDLRTPLHLNEITDLKESYQWPTM